MKLVMLTAIAIVVAAILGLTYWLWTPDTSRPRLEAAYLRSPGDLIDMGGYRLHVRDTGPKAATTLVMLHGFGASLHTFEPWAQMLEHDYRVIRFDLPGSGLSDPDPTGLYTDERTMDLLQKLLKCLEVNRAVLVGNSIGGRLAWKFAAAHPNLVSKLVLISPDGFASPGFEYGHQPDIPFVMELMRYALPKAMVRSNIVAAYGDPKALTDQTFERYYDLLLAPGSREAMIERMRQTILVDPESDLRTIKIPVLLLWGLKDAMIPVANSADYLLAMPQARLVTFPSLGHVPHEESPQLSLVAVQKFLSQD